MAIPLKAQKKVRIITSDMYSLTLLGATALVVFGGRALVHAARAWVFNNKSAFQHGIHVSQISREQQQSGSSFLLRQ
jgi:hypothetical protein